MPINIIKIDDEIPSISFAIKNKSKIEIKNTTVEFKDKNIVLIAVPGPFVSEYASSMIKGYEYYYKSILNLGINDIFCTSSVDPYIMNKWFEFEKVKNIKQLPDGNLSWSNSIGMSVNMSNSYMGIRTHRYVMIINNNRVKRILYEDFTRDPHNCFLNTNVESTIKYLESISNTWESF